MRNPRLRLTDSDLLRKLMQLAPTGPLSVRGLAQAAGISKTRTDDLLHGRYPTVTEETATRIAEAVGVHRAALFTATSSTSVYVDTEQGGPVEHQRTVDAAPRRRTHELGQDQGPVRADGERTEAVAPHPVHRAGPPTAPGRHREADRRRR
ncbi:helix-turn-helix domain-containing protein [Streptomyces sp. RK76]|nr:helix-turn-helix domain-containing protein [Streptomyces sp. RK76]